MSRCARTAIALLTVLSTGLAYTESVTTEPLRGDLLTTASAEESTSPATLTDALAHLKRTLPEGTLQAIRGSEDETMAEYHFGLGMGLRNSWGLWGNSPLVGYFRSLGIKHPDDMSAIVLTSLWRDLHHKPIALEEQVAYYKEYWKRNTGLPEGTTCPVCAAVLRGGVSRTGEAPFTISHAETYYYTCTRCHRLWLYTWDQGLKPPDPETRKLYCHPDNTVTSAPYVSRPGSVTHLGRVPGVGGTQDAAHTP